MSILYIIGTHSCNESFPPPTAGTVTRLKLVPSGPLTATCHTRPDQDVDPHLHLPPPEELGLAPGHPLLLSSRPILGNRP